MGHGGGAFGESRQQIGGTDVDAFGLPSGTFGDPMPDDFFAVLGRLLAVNGSIEYLLERFEHLPDHETESERKVAQFRRRYAAGRNARNAIVHSRWVMGADSSNPDTILGFRYKTRPAVSGTVATVSISDIPDSEREQDVVRYTMSALRKMLRTDIATLSIGQQAYTAISIRWAAMTLKSDIDASG